MLASSIYEGKLFHRRLTPAAHEFTYPIYLAYLDIDQPKEAATDADAAKKQAEERAAEVTKVQSRVQWTLILFPAALFALFGIFRWRWRESARANLTLD